MMGFSDTPMALAMRDVIEKFTREFINRERPAVKYGRCISYNVFTGVGRVLQPLDAEPVDVFFPGGLGVPKTDVNDGEGQGQLIRFTGKPGAYYAEAIQSQATQWNNPQLVNPVIKGGTFFHKPKHRTIVKVFDRPSSSTQTQTFMYLGLGKGLELGNVGWIDLTITHQFFTSHVKRYRIDLVGWYENNSDYYTLVPHENTGPSSEDDFEIEAKFTNSFRSIIFRIRPTGFTSGTNSYEALFQIYADWPVENVFHPDLQGPLTTTPPAKVWGADRAVGAYKGPFGSPEYEFMRQAQDNLTQTGAVWSNNSRLRWTQFVTTPGVSILCPDGTFEIGMPASGDNLPVYGKTGIVSSAVTAEGVALAAGDRLYYDLPLAAGAASQSRWRIVGKNSKFLVPNHWLLLATRHDISPIGYVRLGTGDRLSDTLVLPLASGWQNYGGAFLNGGIKMGDGQRVYLEGLVQNNSGATHNAGAVLATLPVGLRPNRQTGYSVATGVPGNTFGRLDIQSGGGLVLPAHAIPQGGFVFLDGINFVAIQ